MRVLLRYTQQCYGMYKISQNARFTQYTSEVAGHNKYTMEPINNDLVLSEDIQKLNPCWEIRFRSCFSIIIIIGERKNHLK